MWNLTKCNGILWHKLPGSGAELAAEGPVEGGVILKPALAAGLLGGRPGAQQSGGGQQPLLGDILVDGTAGELLEPAHEVVFAGKHLPGKGVHGQLLAQVVVDVGQGLGDFGVVLADRLVPVGAVPDHGPVEADQQLKKAGPGQQVPPKAPVAQGGLQAPQQSGQLRPLPAVGAHQGELPLPGQVEAQAQVLPPGAAGPEKAGVQIDHHPLIGLLRVGHRLVDQMVAHQQHVPGL